MDILVVQALQHEILVCLHRLEIVLRILDMARSPRYFTAETVGSCHTARFEGEARLQPPQPPGPCWPISQAPGSPHCQPLAPQTPRLSMPGAANWATESGPATAHIHSSITGRDMLPAPMSNFYATPGRDHAACRVDLKLLPGPSRKNLVTFAPKPTDLGATRSACLVNLKETVGPWGGLPTPGLLYGFGAPLAVSPVPQPPHPSHCSQVCSPWMRAGAGIQRHFQWARAEPHSKTPGYCADV